VREPFQIFFTQKLYFLQDARAKNRWAAEDCTRELYAHTPATD